MRGDPLGQIEWLEWSGLPAALNQVRAGAWSVFKKIAELDCRAHREPGAVEIAPNELAERCGLAVDALLKIIEVLRKKGYLRCYVPDEPAEDALLEIIVPLKTPADSEDVAKRASDPLLRDRSQHRYARAARLSEAEEEKIQAVVDLYLNHLSQKLNTFVLEQIQIAARRFELEAIRAMIERAERHNLRNMGWVLKELIREEGKMKARG